MSEITQILSRIEQGDVSGSSELLPLVYDELRNLAAARMQRETPGQTLQATALVHEAYLRLVDSSQIQTWNGRGHFFGAAAEAMRRILVERARQKASIRGGGCQNRVELVDFELTASGSSLAGRWFNGNSPRDPGRVTAGSQRSGPIVVRGERFGVVFDGASGSWQHQ